MSDPAQTVTQIVNKLIVIDENILPLQEARAEYVQQMDSVKSNMRRVNWDEMNGLGSEDENLTDAELFEYKNEDLSKPELARKLSILEDKLREVDTQLSQQKAKRDELQRFITSSKTETLQNAERAMTMSQAFNQSTKINDYISAWRIVNSARSVAYYEFLQSPKNKDLAAQKGKYLVAAREIFGKMIVNLPPEMQLLKVFYTIGDYGNVEKYLMQFAAVQNDPAKYSAMIQQMQQDVEAASKARAAESLNKQEGFSGLPQNVQQELITQRAYIIRLRAFISFSDLGSDDPLRKQLYDFSTQLDENIKNAILKTQSLEQSKQDYARIKVEIAKRDTEMRKRIFFQQFTDKTSAVLGAGGAMTAWLLGGGVPGAAAATATVATAVAKSAYEANYMLKGEEVEADKALLEKVNPVDYEFIASMDKVWGEHTAKPIGKVNIVGETLTEAGIRKGNEAVAGAQSAFGNVIGKAWAFVSGKILNFVANLSPKTKALLAFAVFITVILPIIMIVIFIPPLWPLLIIAATMIGASIVAKQLGIPLTKAAGASMNVIRNTTLTVANTVNYVLSPINSLVANLKQGKIGSAALSIGAAIAVGVAGAVLLPVALPGFLIAGAVGGIAGAYLGLSFGESINYFYNQPKEIARTLNTARKEVKGMHIDLSVEQIKNLNALYPGFSDKLQKHFKEWHADLFKQVKELQKQASPDPDVIAKLAASLSRIENDWQEISIAIDNLPHTTELLCKLLEDSLHDRYEEKRAEFIAQAEARKTGAAPDKEEAKPAAYKERDRHFMGFGAKSTKRSAAEVIGPAPSFKVAYNDVNYAKERAQLKEMADIMSIVGSIRSKQARA